MKEIKGYEGSYSATADGKIWSHKRQIFLKQSHDTHGYLKVGFYAKGKTRTYPIHRMIAELFIPKIKGKNCVNHKNGIKDDNRVENLEWCTYSENNKHAYNTKLKIPVCGEKQGLSKLKEKDIHEIRKLLKDGMSHRKIAKEFNVGKTTITRINRGTIWKHIPHKQGE